MLRHAASLLAAQRAAPPQPQPLELRQCLRSAAAGLQWTLDMSLLHLRDQAALPLEQHAAAEAPRAAADCLL